MSVRLNVNLNDQTAAALRDVAERRGLTMTEATRQAIAWLKFVDDEVVTAHRKIQLVSTTSDEVKEIFVPTV